MMLLIHDNQPDPIVSAILSAKDQWSEPIVALSVEQILQDAIIFDEIEDGQPRLSWTFSDPMIGTIRNHPDIKLVSRLRSVPPALFADFHSEDKEYALTEFHAYMTFALNAFPVKLNSPGFFGLAGNQFPFPIQWDLVKKASLGLAVPSYYLGATLHCPFDFGSQPVILNHTYGYRHWKPGGRPTGPSTFAVLRPQGDPYFCLVIGGESLVLEGPGAPSLNPDLSARLRSLAVKVSEVLSSPIAEILFFVSGDQITFGVLDIVPAATTGHPLFGDLVIRGLQGFFERNPHAN
jgi:hypothetical protein